MFNKNHSNEISTHIGSLLKSYRKEVGMTGEELGLHLDLSQQQISRYERGKSSLTIEGLIDILLALKLEDHEIECFVKSILQYYQKKGDPPNSALFLESNNKTNFRN